MPAQSLAKRLQAASAGDEAVGGGCAEDISMEEVLGTGTHKQPAAAEEADAAAGREPDGLDAVVSRQCASKTGH